MMIENLKILEEETNEEKKISNKSIMYRVR